jgi:hypothetical protein
LKILQSSTDTDEINLTLAIIINIFSTEKDTLFKEKKNHFQKLGGTKSIIELSTKAKDIKIREKYLDVILLTTSFSLSEKLYASDVPFGSHGGEELTKVSKETFLLFLAPLEKIYNNSRLQACKNLFNFSNFKNITTNKRKSFCCKVL